MTNIIEVVLIVAVLAWSVTDSSAHKRERQRQFRQGVLLAGTFLLVAHAWADVRTLRRPDPVPTVRCTSGRTAVTSTTIVGHTRQINVWCVRRPELEGT